MVISDERRGTLSSLTEPKVVRHDKFFLKNNLHYMQIIVTMKQWLLRNVFQTIDCERYVWRIK